MDLSTLPSIWKIPKDVWVKRLQGWCWQAGMILLALAVDFLIANLGDFNIPSWLVVAIGLALAQWSKQIKNNLDQIKEFAAVGMGAIAAGKVDKPTPENK